MKLGEFIVDFFYPPVLPSELTLDLRRSHQKLDIQERILRQTGDSSGYMRALEEDNNLYKVGPPPQIPGDLEIINTYDVPYLHGQTHRINCLAVAGFMLGSGSLVCAGLLLLSSLHH